MSELIPLLGLSTVRASDIHAVARQNPPAICSRQQTGVSGPICQSQEYQRGLEYLKTLRKRPTSNAERPTPNFRLDDCSGRSMTAVACGKAALQQDGLQST